MSVPKDNNWAEREGYLPSHPHDKRPEREARSAQRELEKTGFTSLEARIDLPPGQSALQKGNNKQGGRSH